MNNPFAQINLPTTNVSPSFYVGIDELVRQIKEEMARIAEDNKLQSSFYVSTDGGNIELYFDEGEISDSDLTILEECHIPYEEPYEAACSVLAELYGCNVDLEINREGDMVMVTLFNVQSLLMTELDRIVTEIDNMTQEEAKGQVALLYNQLKTHLKW